METIFHKGRTIRNNRGGGGGGFSVQEFFLSPLVCRIFFLEAQALHEFFFLSHTFLLLYLIYDLRKIYIII